MSHFISINSGVVKGPTMSNKDSHHWGHSKGLEPGTKTRYIFSFFIIQQFTCFRYCVVRIFVVRIEFCC